MSKITAWSSFLYNLRWMLALLLAGLFSIWTRRGWVRIGKAFALWGGYLHNPEDKVASPELVKLRLETCEKCPIFFKPLGTCGTPAVKRLHSYGCWCFMKEAAQLHDKTCYLDDEIFPGYPGGWEDAIDITTAAASRTAQSGGPH